MAKGGGGGRSAGKRPGLLRRMYNAEKEFLTGTYTPKGIRGNFRMQRASMKASSAAYKRSASGQGFFAQRRPSNFVRNTQAGARASTRVNKKGWRAYS